MVTDNTTIAERSQETRHRPTTQTSTLLWVKTLEDYTVTSNAIILTRPSQAPFPCPI